MGRFLNAWLDGLDESPRRCHDAARPSGRGAPGVSRASRSAPFGAVLTAASVNPQTGCKVKFTRPAQPGYARTAQRPLIRMAPVT